MLSFLLLLNFVYMSLILGGERYSVERVRITCPGFVTIISRMYCYIKMEG